MLCAVQWLRKSFNVNITSLIYSTLFVVLFFDSINSSTIILKKKIVLLKLTGTTSIVEVLYSELLL